MSNAYYAVKCLIWDESIRLTEREAFMVSKGKDIIRVCDKCKDAVKSMRNEEMLKIIKDPEYGTAQVRFW